MKELTLDKVIKGQHKGYKVNPENMLLTIDDLVSIKRMFDRDDLAREEEKQRERDQLIKDITEVLAPFYTKFEEVLNEVRGMKAKVVEIERKVNEHDNKIEKLWEEVFDKAG